MNKFINPVYNNLIILNINITGGFIMENNDTIQLLKECDSGTKMAVDSINEILDKVKATELRDVLNDRQ